MADTIDRSIMDAASERVRFVQAAGLLPIVHTVSITLNGAHGGADVTVEGFDGKGEAGVIAGGVS